MNKINKILLIFAGIFGLLTCVFHLMFWNLFGWEKELANLNQNNRVIMQMLNIGAAYMVFMMGSITLFFNVRLTESQLGRCILISFSMMWFVRLIMEFVFPGSSMIIAIVLFVIGSAYLVPLFSLRSNQLLYEI